jgi:hypothetical protein
MVEAGIYKDVDAVILSGFASAINPAIPSDSEEANTDPEFANLPNGYYIFPAGLRAEARLARVRYSIDLALGCRFDSCTMHFKSNCLVDSRYDESVRPEIDV